MSHRSRFRKGLRRQAGQLRMTSMMDIFVTMLFFLLKSFVSGGEVVTPPPGVELPLSSSEAQPEPAVVVAVVGNSVLVGDRAVADLGSGDLWLAPLAQELARVKEKSRKLAELRGDTSPRRDRAVVQGDRGLEFKNLQPVLYTLARSDFQDVSLAVLQRD